MYIANKAADHTEIEAFSLVEVVIALGIISFALAAIIGTFSVGIKFNQDSEEQIRAANVVSLLIATRRAAPTNSLANSVLPTLNRLYPSSATTNYITVYGSSTASKTNAAYLISYSVGTNAFTGIHLSQINLRVSWPPMMNPSNPSAGRYELTTYIPLP